MQPASIADTRQAQQAFGNLRPSKLLEVLIRLCHKGSGPFYSRILAPITRKLVIGFGDLPVDICLGYPNLRCTFTDNYSEKKFVFTPWRYDHEERQFIKSRLPASGVFVDIGANIGLYTLTAQQALNKAGTILAFEPNPETMRRLAFNLQINAKAPENQPEIHLLNIGVADKDSSFELKIDRSNLGQSSISARSRSQQDTGESIAIHCRPLVAVLEEQGITAIDILKIDIEGAEDLALAPYLQNAPRQLLAKTIIIENSEKLWGCDLFALIESCGYALEFTNKMNSVYSLSAQVHSE